MDVSSALHPTDQTLLAYGLGKLDASTSASVDQHLETCPECRRRVGELSGDSAGGRHREAHGPAAGSGESPTTVATWGAGPPSPRAEPLAPELADHPDYEIIRELGRGGMGVVYLARNTLMGRLEVLKVVSQDLVERKGALDRFLREIRSAAKLQHTNIVSAHSATRLGKSVVLAMEYVEGDDLAKVVKTGGPLPVANACYFIYQAALGLQHAHERGMVHRDIKPANLILARDGRKATVKVLDFGLAKVTSETPVDSGLTHEGQIIGTPDYIAPEQTLDAHKADIRADIYSLGCTFYYLLTGRPPFQGKSVFEILQAHQSTDAKPLNLVRPDVPVELAAVAAKMLAKDPARRYQTPGALAKELLPFFKSTAHQTAVPRAEVPGVSSPAAASSQPLRPGTAPPQPATEVAEPTRPVAPHANPEGVAWEHLIEFKETEEAKAASVDAPLPSRPRTPSKWKTTVAVGGFGAVLLGIVIATTTNKGRTRNETTNPSAVEEISSGSDAPGAPSSTSKTSTLKRLPGSLAPPGTSKGALKKLTAPVGIKMVSIPAGEFLMGSPDDDKEAQGQEKPRHRVRITRPFYLGATEITVGQFRAVVEKTGYRTDAEEDGKGGSCLVDGKWEHDALWTWRSPGFDQTDDDPVVQVSWNDAVAFCNQLSELEGFKPVYPLVGGVRSGGDGYRLPTEAEWEYACRAGTSTRYGFGDDPVSLGDYAWFGVNSAGKTHSVGRKRPNAFGLYDIHGNVWEWCEDGYDRDYYLHSPGTDPSGPVEAAGRVYRGGCWSDSLPYARSACRSGYAPGNRFFDLGFRVARDQPKR